MYVYRLLRAEVRILSFYYSISVDLQKNHDRIAYILSKNKIHSERNKKDDRSLKKSQRKKKSSVLISHAVS